MEQWFIQSIWIAMFGFLKEFRPEDPYITQYLSSPPMNFTNDEVSVQNVLIFVFWRTYLCTYLFGTDIFKQLFCVLLLNNCN